DANRFSSPFPRNASNLASPPRAPAANRRWSNTGAPTPVDEPSLHARLGVSDLSLQPKLPTYPAPHGPPSGKLGRLRRVELSAADQLSLPTLIVEDSPTAGTFSSLLMKRREFLCRSAVAATALAFPLVVPRHVLGAAHAPGPNDRIQLG